MKNLLCSLVLACGLAAVHAAEEQRAMFGVVVEENAFDQQGGVVVRAVRPGSPAESLNLQPGDRIELMNGLRVNSKEEMRALLRSLRPGQSLEILYYKAGSAEPDRATVVLAARPARLKSNPISPGGAFGGDRMVRPLVINPEIRAAMRGHRRAVVQQLSEMAGDFSPGQVTEHLQAIRNLARDANPRGRGWMLGKAGEVTLQFRDGEGTLVLYGADNALTLRVYDSSGVLLHTCPLNTPEERAAVPQQVIERLKRLR